jgi:peptidoglycan hydrolase-like protein with peptidoglycan-binding domain
MNRLNFEGEPFGEFESDNEESEELERGQARDHRRGSVGGASQPRVVQRNRPRASASSQAWGGVGRGLYSPAFHRRLTFKRGLGRWGRARFNRWHGRRPFRFLRNAFAFGNAGFGAPSPASELILWVQSTLEGLLGDGVPQTGILDLATRRAISTFQSQQQLPATGVPDEATVSALGAATADAGGADADTQEFEGYESEGEDAEQFGPRGRVSDFLPDVLGRELGESEYEQPVSKKDMVVLAKTIPEAPYSDTLMSRLTKALDIFAAVDTALAIFAVPIGTLLGGTLTVAGPVLSIFASFLALGAPYAAARAEIARKKVRWGFALGVVLGADNQKWPYAKRLFWVYQAERNNFDPEAGKIAQKAFNLGLVTGFVQGRKLSKQQRAFLWKSFAPSLSSGDLNYFSGDIKTWSRAKLLDWYSKTAATFLKLYAKN